MILRGAQSANHAPPANIPRRKVQRAKNGNLAVLDLTYPLRVATQQIVHALRVVQGSTNNQQTKMIARNATHFAKTTVTVTTGFSKRTFVSLGRAGPPKRHCASQTVVPLAMQGRATTASGRPAANVTGIKVRRGWVGQTVNLKGSSLERNSATSCLGRVQTQRLQGAKQCPTAPPRIITV